MRLVSVSIRIYIDVFWKPELNINRIVSHFSEFQQQEDQWIPVLYQGLHFFFINLISQGILLFNFGFAIANKKTSVITSSKRKDKTSTEIKERKRRETFLDLALGGGTGSDEEDDEEYYGKTLFVSTGGNDMMDQVKTSNPFKMGAKLKSHIR